MLAAARKLWRAPLLVLQHSSLLSTATCNSFAPTARNRGAPDLQKLIKLADCNILGKQRYAHSLSAVRPIPAPNRTPDTRGITACPTTTAPAKRFGAEHE